MSTPTCDTVTQHPRCSSACPWPMMMPVPVERQAVIDQQAGVPITARFNYTTIRDQSRYLNAWLESMRVNGIPKGFER